jgi:hypothetical protein
MFYIYACPARSSHSQQIYRNLLKAYHNAIVLQNKFLSNVRSLPVIDISPKALQQKIQFDESDPERVIDILNCYQYFSSIEPTPQSEKLGKYLFITTHDKFEAPAKTWISTDLPQIWAGLDHNFLDELPPLVQCPHLTTSNLKDLTTSRTVGMLNASRIPNDATVASKWSQPPQIGRTTNGPASARTVNYTPTNFPALRKKARKGKTCQNSDTTDISTATAQKKENINNIDSASTHSNASATSVGTTFTKEDGQSLFTSLTKSFIDDMKSQSAQQNPTISDLISSQVKCDEAYRKSNWNNAKKKPK